MKCLKTIICEVHEYYFKLKKKKSFLLLITIQQKKYFIYSVLHSNTESFYGKSKLAFLWSGLLKNKFYLHDLRMCCYL